jgi:hypothetical protein
MVSRSAMWDDRNAFSSVHGNKRLPWPLTGDLPAAGKSCVTEPQRGQPRFHDEDTVTVADAARIAERSVRTIRRAYLSGRLVAYRDANGRRITIRYSHLRAWLLAEPIVPLPEPPSADLLGRVDVRRRPPGPATTGNLELLAAARRRRARRARGSAPARRGGADSASP